MVDKSGHHTNLTRTVAVGTVAVLILTVLLATQVAGAGQYDGAAEDELVADETLTSLEVGDSGTVLESHTPYHLPYYEVVDFEVSNTGKGSRGMEAGDTLTLEATIRNTGTASGSGTMNMRLDRPGGGTGISSYITVELDPDEETAHRDGTGAWMTPTAATGGFPSTRAS
ncbi:MAG: hypothetical protein U5J64_12730, partial [Halobacteriales archaeon]|nr:hypothetical protein [Halobacteriales archaeon]